MKKNMLFRFLILFLFTSKIFAAQGDLDESVFGILKSIDQQIVFKECSYEVEEPGSFITVSAPTGESIRFYIPKGTTKDEAIALAPTAWKMKQRGEDVEKGPVRIFKKSVPSIFDCQDKIELIYNTLYKENKFREK